MAAPLKYSYVLSKSPPQGVGRDQFNGLQDQLFLQQQQLFPSIATKIQQDMYLAILRLWPFSDGEFTWPFKW